MVCFCFLADGRREALLLESPRHSAMKTNHLVIEMGPKGYGMILKSIRVYIGDSNNYRIHHIVQVSVACGHPSFDNPFCNVRRLRGVDQHGSQV